MAKFSLHAHVSRVKVLPWGIGTKARNAAKIAIGDRYGVLTVLGEPFVIPSYSNVRARLCVLECDCGKVLVKECSLVVHRRYKYCGAHCTLNGFFKNGIRRSGLYNTWFGMVDRCHNPKNHAYRDYGGRGISVCDEWRNDSLVFVEWARASGWARGLQIDRINNDGNYEPGNCRFVTPQKNSRNLRSARILTAFGESKQLVEWAEDHRCAVKYATLRSRIYSGWDAERAITTN